VRRCRACGKRDLRVQPLGPRALEFIERGEFRGRHQRLRRFRRAGLQLRLGGGERSSSPARGIGSQLGRSLQERGHGRNAAAAPGPVGRVFQLSGHRLVETGRRVGTMPGSPIGIGLRIGCLG
jgi:hypothetical protein